MTTPAGSLVVYCAWSTSDANRVFHVVIDGYERGTVTGSQQLTLAPPLGMHTVLVSDGVTSSSDVAINVRPDAQTVMVVDAPSDGGALTIRETDESRAAMYGSHGPVPYPKPQRRISTSTIGWTAAALLVIGLVLSSTVNQAVGFVPAFIGLVTLIVLYFRNPELRRKRL